MRRFNYTGRERIEQKATSIRYTPNADGKLRMSLELRLGDIRTRIDPDAILIVEARDGASFERIELGTLSSLGEPYRRDIILEAFGPQQMPTARIKAVKSDGTYLLSALARELRPKGGGSSLLRITVGPVEGEVFRIDVDGSELPTMVLNDKLKPFAETGVKSLARDKAFRALVFPQAVRYILIRYMIDGLLRDEEDDTSCPAKWVAFARRLAGPLPSDDDEPAKLKWIDDVAAAFARDNDLVALYGKVLTA